MKEMAISFVAMIVIAVAASYVLEAIDWSSASGRHTVTQGSVRL